MEIQKAIWKKLAEAIWKVPVFWLYVIKTVPSDEAECSVHLRWGMNISMALFNIHFRDSDLLPIISEPLSDWPPAVTSDIQIYGTIDKRQSIWIDLFLESVPSGILKSNLDL